MGVYDGPVETGMPTKYKMFWGTALSVSWSAKVFALFCVNCKDHDNPACRGCLYALLCPIQIIGAMIAFLIGLLLDIVFILVYCVTLGYCFTQCEECAKWCYVEEYTDPMECLQ